MFKAECSKCGWQFTDYDDWLVEWEADNHETAYDHSVDVMEVKRHG